MKIMKADKYWKFFIIISIVFFATGSLNLLTIDYSNMGDWNYVSVICSIIQVIVSIFIMVTIWFSYIKKNKNDG